MALGPDGQEPEGAEHLGGIAARLEVELDEELRGHEAKLVPVLVQQPEIGRRIVSAPWGAAIRMPYSSAPGGAL